MGVKIINQVPMLRPPALEFFQNGYLTLIINLALIIMVFSNRSVRIKKGSGGLIFIASGLTLLLSFFEYLEQWCDTYHKSYHILYYKAAAVYILYPLITLIILYLAGVQRKLLIAMPQFLVTGFALVDLSELTGFIYRYEEDHTYAAGPLHWMPFWVETIYILLLIIQSVKALRSGDRAFGMIVAYMSGSCLFSILLVREGVLSNQAIPTVVAIELFIYYYYLTAIRYREMEEALSAEQLELERSKSNLLMAQIRPHFINSNLAVIRSLCYEDSEKAVEMIDHFSTYLRENIKQINDRTLVSFEKEMESVDNYLYLEMQRFQDRIQVKKELTVTDFEVPPLSIQTIVENAIRHGISMTGRQGTVTIKTRERDGNLIISVGDDGKGFDVSAMHFDGVAHVGIKNVTDRYQNLLSGSVNIESAIGEGTLVTICFPRRGVAEKPK